MLLRPWINTKKGESLSPEVNFVFAKCRTLLFFAFVREDTVESSSSISKLFQSGVLFSNRLDEVCKLQYFIDVRLIK